jgi:hypothetical protein
MRIFAGVRPMAIAMKEVSPGAARRSSRRQSAPPRDRSWQPENASATESRYAVAGVKELMAELQATEEEYRRWIAQYATVFLDPACEQHMVAMHAARLQAHLDLDLLSLDPLTKCQ